jgi:metallophosphoesterase (TIGR03767 family)
MARPGYMPGMRRILLIAGAVLLCAAVPAGARPQDTTVSTIVDADGDTRLERGPGERHLVREELGAAQAARRQTRRRLIFFGQMTDTHVVDEESPLRVEFLDETGGPFTSAYRPQEGISAQVLDEMVRRLRTTTSPIGPSRSIELVMTTGDNTDNTQQNETRWMIDVMDGRTVVDPDSGVPGACGDGGYDGARGGGRYYEPDASGGEDGPGYTPADGVRDYPGLFERMNEPFRAGGFGALPWYAVFGNHDGLVQGNQPRNPVLEAYATGCAKVTGLSPAAVEAIRAAAEQGGTGEEVRDALVAGLQQAATNPAAPGTETAVVPPDPRRRPLRKTEWIAEHFATRGVPAGHGFGFRPESAVDGMGYYSFAPKPGLRFVVLDTVAEHGLEEGNLDDRQFDWLHAELLKAKAMRERVMVFAHHGLGTMGQPPASPFAPGDTGGDLSPVVHFGEGPRNTETVLPCTQATAEEPPRDDETLRCLLLRHRSVVAFVNGHEHANRVDPVLPAAGDAPTAGRFWEINTASHIDWPQQSRVLDLFDNRDGTLSIFATVVDHGAAPRPGATGPLASVSRELSFNDPHAQHNGSDGDGGGRGDRLDRNVELVLPDPYGTP